MTLRRPLLWSLAGAALIIVLCCAGTAFLLFSPAYKGDRPAQLYVTPSLANADSLRKALCQAGMRTAGLRLLALAPGKAKPGMYVVSKGQSLANVYLRLRSGRQDPVRLTLPSLRTTCDLASCIASQLMLDSAQIASALNDSLTATKYGLTTATIISLFLPDTYEVYWSSSLPSLMERMQAEHRRFWTPARLALADSLGLTPAEVATLASIIDEETNADCEKPTIAGMYINRLRQGMPLQADPTVKFALKDFSLRRILQEHLLCESPYNTYLHEGLPPGPIRMPSRTAIDAVLSHEPSTYLYMCAKEDFSGTHNFASTYPEHLRNAQRYRRALDRRGIR